MEIRTFWCLVVSSPCPTEGWSGLSLLRAWAERALAELAKGRVNRKMQETGEREKEKKLQHPLKTAASPWSLGYRGWEERGEGRFLASLLLQAPGAPQ